MSTGRTYLLQLEAGQDPPDPTPPARPVVAERSPLCVQERGGDGELGPQLQKNNNGHHGVSCCE